MSEVADQLHALRNVEPRTLMLEPTQAAAKLAEAVQAMPTTEMRANETRMFTDRPTTPIPTASPAVAVAKKSLPSWLLVVVLCAVILGGVTAAMLLR